MGLEKFPDRVKDLVYENLTRVTDVGEETGLGEANVSRYINGRCLPTLSAAVRLADYFNVTLDYLLGLEDDSEATLFMPCPPFGQRLDEVLKKFNLSRYKLVKLTGIAESNIRYWYQGKIAPTVESAVKIAQALGCTVDFLIGREKG